MQPYQTAVPAQSTASPDLVAPLPRRDACLSPWKSSSGGVGGNSSFGPSENEPSGPDRTGPLKACRPPDPKPAVVAVA